MTEGMTMSEPVPSSAIANACSCLLSNTTTACARCMYSTSRTFCTNVQSPRSTSTITGCEPGASLSRSLRLYGTQPLASVGK